MYRCPECGDRARTLYEWNGIDYCGMCQQENIERYEVTLRYRFRLLFQLTKDYIQAVTGQVFFPVRGMPRRALGATGRGLKRTVYYVQSKVCKAKR